MVGTLGRYELSQGNFKSISRRIIDDYQHLTMGTRQAESPFPRDTPFPPFNHCFSYPSTIILLRRRYHHDRNLNWETGSEEDLDLAARFHTGSIPSAGGVLDNSEPSASP
ncbi:predicted protein [Coccidioides posadasii str. Silveira]|uniref:Predicted protein n=1 Tax=Coccidioides posadasii (strain RMSCC 757 / Silveira) TaxID=443226 RepID=E9D1P2_COCPS|nr:predicted protein [Coccidioides posadasii str. Silveira]